MHLSLTGKNTKISLSFLLFHSLICYFLSYLLYLCLYCLVYFCSTFLGLFFTSIYSWGDLVPKDVEVWAWEPSAISEWGDLVKHLTADDISIFGNAKIPVTFYGHSLGALVAFEVACRLQDQGMRGTRKRNIYIHYVHSFSLITCLFSSF